MISFCSCVVSSRHELVQVSLDPFFGAVLVDLFRGLLCIPSAQFVNAEPSQTTYSVHPVRFLKPAIVEVARLSMLAKMAESAVDVSAATFLWT